MHGERQAATWRHHGGALLVLAAMAAILFWRIGQIGPTVDEPFHLVRGLAYWWTDSTALSYAHPPLANALQMLPAALLTEPLDLTTVPGWEERDHSLMAEYLAAMRYARVRPMLMMGRYVNMGLGIAMVAYLWLWASRRFDATVALVAVTLVAFNPTVLAHAQLVTTDLPVTFAILAVATTFVDYLSPPRGGLAWPGLRLGAFALAVAAALCTKFTALALVPLLASIGVFWAASGWGRFAGPGLGLRLVRVSAEIVFVGLVALLCVGAIYRFQEWGLSMDQVLAHPEPQCHLTDDFDQGFLEQRWLIAALPGWLRLPVPYTWLFGMEMVRHHGALGHNTWFMGFTYARMNPAYFPVMLLIKTPVWVTLGLGVYLVSAIRRRRLPGPHAILLLIGGFLLALLCTSNLNIGVRHALPIVPPLTVLAAIGLRRALRGIAARGLLDAPNRRRAAHLAALLVLLSLPAIAAANAGHLLTWFSVGRTVGYQISIVGEDWGQDATELVRAMEEDPELRPVRYLGYGIFSVSEVRHQGRRPIRVQCGGATGRFGWFVAHRAMAVRFPKCLGPLAERPPDRVIGEHLFAWELDSTPRGDRR